MLPDALIVCLPSQKTQSPRVYFNNIGCTDSLRHGNGLSALLLLTRAGRASASFYFALVNLTKECNISLVKCQMA